MPLSRRPRPAAGKRKRIDYAELGANTSAMARIFSLYRSAGIRPSSYILFNSRPRSEAVGFCKRAIIVEK